MAGARTIYLVSAIALVLLPGCERKLAELPPENVVANECYKPFFNLARLGDVEGLKGVLSKETIRYQEEIVFKERRIVEDWPEFLSLYKDMKTGLFIDSVTIDGDRALVRDQIGGRLHCVREDGVWKVDMTGD